jgi:hypothetical protein
MNEREIKNTAPSQWAAAVTEWLYIKVFVSRTENAGQFTGKKIW